MNISFEYPTVRVEVDTDSPWVPKDIGGFFNVLKAEYEIEVVLRKAQKSFVTVGTLNQGHTVVDFLKQLLQYGEPWDFRQIAERFAAPCGKYGKEFEYCVIELHSRLTQCIGVAKETKGRDSCQP